MPDAARLSAPARNMQHAFPVLVSPHTNKTLAGSFVKILVVDDHPLILEALHHVLKQLDSDIEVRDAQSAETGRALVAANADAGLLLLDLTLPGADGLDLLAEIREANPGIPVVVLSGSDRREDVVRALDLGAMGFIPKTSSNQIMLGALRLVLSGGVYLPPFALAHHGADSGAALSAAEPDGRKRPATPRDLGLTDRQAQVLGLILKGKPNKVICRELGLAEGTVKIHVAAILRALNVSTRTQAVIEASRIGLQMDGILPTLAAPAEQKT
jgi:DNA-binding NarL/FixJ family response regulator